MMKVLPAILLFSSLCLSSLVGNDEEATLAESYSAPLGLPPIPWPDDNPYSEKKAALGKLLYFDKRLSADGTVSCASCHGLSKAFADHDKVSTGVYGRQGSRNSQTIINAAYHPLLFWDGRAKSLEEQCKGPIANILEMSESSDPHIAHFQCQERVKRIKGYLPLFKEVFGKENIDIDDIAQAIATFERTILSGNSPYDKYAAGDKTALSAEQIDGYRIFRHVGCNNCHFGPTFSDERFLNIGVGMDAQNPDLGRYEITQDKKDWGAFRVPILRDVANTPPYMHDGSLKNLDEVVEYYNTGGIKNANLHTLMRPLNLSEKDKKNLVAFLEALNGEGWEHVTEPKELPE